MTLDEAFERCADVQADIRTMRDNAPRGEYARRLRRAAKYLDIVMTEIEEAIECSEDTLANN